MRHPLVILFPFVGDPENEHFRPLLGPREGRAEAPTCNFVPFVGDPGECRGYIAFSPSFGQLRRQG